MTDYLQTKKPKAGPMPDPTVAAEVKKWRGTHIGLLEEFGSSVFRDLEMLLAIGNRFKIGQFTVDLATIAATTTITGVGFTPKIVIFFANVSSTTLVSLGFDNGTTMFMVFYVLTASVWANVTTDSIGLIAELGVTQVAGNISSMDVDGFTITWGKTGSPTGTAAIGYLAIG